MSTPILPSNRPDPTLPTARGNRLFRRSLSGLVCKVSVLDALYGPADFPTVQTFFQWKSSVLRSTQWVCRTSKV